MGLLSRLLLLPITGPLDGTLWVARQIGESVERERNSPAALRDALREAERRLLAGDLSDDEYELIEDELLARLKAASG